LGVNWADTDLDSKPLAYSAKPIEVKILLACSSTSESPLLPIRSVQLELARALILR
jgi:hypothetical protein